MSDEHNDNAGKAQYHPPPAKFWGKDAPSLTIQLADLTPREWGIIVKLGITFLVLLFVMTLFTVYGVKAITKAEMDRGFLQNGYVRADEIIRQGGFVYSEKIYAIGESSIMTIPEKVQNDFKEALRMNEKLREKVTELQKDVEFERNRKLPVMSPR